MSPWQEPTRCWEPMTSNDKQLEEQAQLPEKENKKAAEEGKS
jgi:hypothetical protein